MVELASPRRQTRQLLEPMPASPANRSLPPFWLPVLAGLPVGACLLVMALPILGHGNASLSRTLYLLAFAFWVVPLTWLQRWLWQRWGPGLPLAVTLLATTYAMALATRILSYAMQGALSKAMDQFTHQGGVMFRGLEGAWLVLVAHCAIHAVVAHYAELRWERENHLATHLLARDAELRALRYQLQPHFLFNVLNAISALSAEGRAQDAQRMVSRLGDFLRTMLEPGNGHEVAVAEEVAVTEGYLEIERIRLAERLRLRWSIGPHVLGKRMPYLLLQPLVENGLRHGIAARLSPGWVDIQIHHRDGKLVVGVINDVPDVRPAGTEAGAARTSIGLENVRARLARLYPQGAALHAGYREDGRFGVEVILPLRDMADSPP
ncbi:sensor histidine kinase [Pseudoxanthomonas sp.]|uniref:sensor histidine kinase n=1 Tax=Pseudoxanthomonas sp. TaxID=1871049 RepID=UPI003F7F3101